MQKGKLGIRLNTYAVVAFLLVLFGQTLLCALVLGVVLIIEKDEWTARQCMQALFVNIAMFVLTAASGLLFWTILAPVAAVIMIIVLYVFTVIAVVRVAKGQEANVPIVKKYADKAFGREPMAPPPYNPGYPQQPGNPYPPQQPPPYQPQPAPPPGTEQQQNPPAPPPAPGV